MVNERLVTSSEFGTAFNPFWTIPDQNRFQTDSLIVCRLVAAAAGIYLDGSFPCSINHGVQKSLVMVESKKDEQACR